MIESTPYIPKEPLISQEQAIELAREFFPDDDYEFKTVRHHSDAFRYQEIGLKEGWGTFAVVFSRRSVKSPPLDLVTIDINDQSGEAKRFYPLH